MVISIVVLVLCLCTGYSIKSKYVQGITNSDKFSVLKSTEIESEVLEKIVANFVMCLKMSSKQYKFEDFPFNTISELKKIEIENEIYHYCEYSNNFDLVYFIFAGDDLMPCYVLDINHSFDDIIEFSGICSYDSEEYKYFESIIKECEDR